MMSPRVPWWALIGGALGAAVIALYGWTATTTAPEIGCATPADAYYNRLVEGFRAGQLSLRQAVPPGLARLADPYDPAVTRPFRGQPFATDRLLDQSYFHGRLYLYFGATPALILFWPYAALTGRYLGHGEAVAVFAALGFALSAGLLAALGRRYFREVSPGVVAAGVLALGLATNLPLLLQRPDVWEVPIACGYAMTMLALVALWNAAHRPAGRRRWLVLASVAYGLAVGARPSLGPGALILCGPVLAAWGERAEGRRRWTRRATTAAAAFVPLALIVLGILIYNAQRFGHPWEFGEHYQLAGDRQDSIRHFSLGNLEYNIRAYFLAPAIWGPSFPYLKGVAMPPVPGHYPERYVFGVLANLPFAWLALAVPLAWHGRGPAERRALRGSAATVAGLFAISATTIGLFYGTCNRYETEFIPLLILMATGGLLGLERWLAHRGSWRWPARLIWGGLLAYSLAFSLLVGLRERAEISMVHGQYLRADGQAGEAIAELARAVRLNPELAEAWITLLAADCEAGRFVEARANFASALGRRPDDALRMFDAYDRASASAGRPGDALAQLEAAALAAPASAALGEAAGWRLFQAGRRADGLVHLEDAVRRDPNRASSQYFLAAALAQSGQLTAALAHARAAVRLAPAVAGAHFGLGLVLLQLGHAAEARAEFERTLAVDSRYEPARELLRQIDADGPASPASP
jgi:Flp pilus assembly protein TadD